MSYQTNWLDISNTVKGYILSIAVAFALIEYRISFLILAIISILWFVIPIKNKPKVESKIIFIALIFPISQAIIQLNQGFQYQEYDNLVRWLLFIPIIYIAQEVTSEYIKRLPVLYLIALSIIVIYENIYNVANGPERYLGIVGNPVLSSVILVLLSVTTHIVSKKVNKKRLVDLIIMILSLYMLIKYGSIGPMITYVLSITFIFRPKLNIFIPLALLILVMVQSSDVVKDRYNRISDEIQCYYNSSISKCPLGTLGHRMIMWEFSIKQFENNKIFGMKRESFNQGLREYAKGLDENLIFRYNQPHSDILSSLVFGGIVGLVSLIMHFSYISKLLINENHDNIILLSLPIALLLMGLTQSILLHSSLHTLYIICVYFLIGLFKGESRIKKFC